MSDILNIFNEIIRATAQLAAAAPSNHPTHKEVDCYGLDPALKGKYGGIHNGDNITPKTTKDFERKVRGKPDIELKFINLEGGWVLEQEIQLLKEQGKAIFVKLEPFIPNPDKEDPRKWQGIETNYYFMDKIIPKEYYNLLLTLATLAHGNSPNLKNQFKIVLQQHDLGKISPELLQDLTGKAETENNYIKHQFSAILKRYNVSGNNDTKFRVILHSLVAKAKKENTLLLKQFDAFLRKYGIHKILPTKYPNILQQLVGRAKGDLEDIATQFNLIFMHNGLNHIEYRNLIEKLVRIASKKYEDLMQQFKMILERNRAGRSPEMLSQLAHHTRREYDNFILELDLVLRKHGIAENFSGTYDHILLQNARVAKQSGIPTLEAFGAEMNGYGEGMFWYPFGLDPVKYILAYRHYHDVKTKAGAKNINYVWNPHVVRKTEKDFTEYYPGDDYVDIIAFDVYTEEGRGSLVPLLKNAIKTMDQFLAENGLQPKDYALGEWGANRKYGEYNQFDQMLNFIEAKDSPIKFHIYYNVNADTGNYKMDHRMEMRYSQHLKKLARDNYNFVHTNLGINPDTRKHKCYLPQIPDPNQIYRKISATEFKTTEELKQRICAPDNKIFASDCLPPYIKDWDPRDRQKNMPPRTLKESELYPLEKEYLPLSIGHAYEFGTHQYLLNNLLIQTLIEKERIPLKAVKKILRIVSYKNPNDPSALRDFAPFTSYELCRDKFLAQHPEMALIKKSAPDFYFYLNQPKLFWDNMIVLYGIYTQKAIESNDQQALQEIVAMGKFFLKSIKLQEKHEKGNHAKEAFISSKYRMASLLLILSEAYSLWRDRPISDYKEGLKYVEEAIEKFKDSGINSRPDYFSITKGILIAADLHAKIAQQNMLVANFSQAEAEYRAAQYLYDRVANLDFSQGTGLAVLPFKLETSSYTAASNIKVIASAQEITSALEENIDRKHINQAEAIASIRGLFQFLRGVALLKQVGYYLEFPFMHYKQKGYEDIIQNMVLVKAGLAEIEKGSRFADLRYFRALGNLVLEKLLISFADSLAYSTSEMSKKDAKEKYTKAIAELKENLPDLFTLEEWKQLANIPQLEDISDKDAIRSDWKDLKKDTTLYKEGFPVKEMLTPDQAATAKSLLQQTHTIRNYRIAFAKQFIQIAEKHLEKANHQLPLKNLYEKGATLIEKAPVLHAELLLEEVKLALRKSEHTKLIDKRLLRGKREIDPQKIKKLLEKVNLAYSILEQDRIRQKLPDTSYLKIEMILTKAALNLSFKMPELRPKSPQAEAYRKKLYPIIDPLLKKPADLSAQNTNRIYHTIVALEGIRKRILIQPEPNRTILLNQLNLKLSLAYIILAAHIEKTFGKIEDLYEMRQSPDPRIREPAEEAIKYINALVDKSKKILFEMEEKTSQRIDSSSKPLLYDIHDLRVEIYHQLAIVYALSVELPLMQHYLHLAKLENIRSSSYFNVHLRSWMLNRFAIPEPESSERASKLNKISGGRRRLEPLIKYIP